MAWSLKKRVIVSCSVGWLVTIVGVVMIPVVELIVEHKVKQTVVIQTDSEVYKYWQNPPVPIYMQIYMFNITNLEEFLNGAKPSVTQKGPYTYSEKRIKENITWNDNGTVTYRQRRLFNFLPHLSAGDEMKDKFITPNPVFWALYRALRFEEDGRIRQLLNLLTRAIGMDLWMERTVNEIIWGYHDPALKVAKYLDSEWFYTDFIGYFMNKNDTNDGVYTVYTGEKDITKLGIIDMYNGSSHLKFWSTEWANMVNGSDGTLGPPYLPKDEMMYSFASDVCRSVAGVYAKDVKTPQGIGLWRFEAPETYMANASVNPDNIGFCTPGEMKYCLGAGINNISNCQMVDSFNLPVALSFPHFLYGDPKYQKAVDGMYPNPEEHKVTIDLEPYTGLVLQAAKRLQVNVYMTPIANVSQTLKLKGVFMPIFWINESAQIDDASADQLFSMLFTPLHIVHILEAVVISLGAAIVVATVLFSVKVKVSQSRKDNTELKDPLVPNLHNDVPWHSPRGSFSSPRGSFRSPSGSLSSYDSAGSTNQRNNIT